jgi:hypothetical protein
MLVLNQNVLRFVLSLLLTSLIAIASAAIYGDEADDAEDARRAKQLAAERLETMREHLLGLEIKSPEATFPAKCVDKPLFRYSDAGRGYVSAAVWKLGDSGRPRAILVTELIPRLYERPCISYEFVSLTTTPFSIKSESLNWSPSATHYEFKPITGAPKPAKLPQQRLKQMRDLADRFSGTEVVEGDRSVLRLLPQPIDRYQPDGEETDGTIFVLAFGTNPELMLFIETDGSEWKYAVGRLSGAESIELKLDDTQVWQGPPVKPGVTSPYTGSIAPIRIPGFDANGREIEE